MSDTSQQCPSVWREYTESGVRACGRPENSPGSYTVQYLSTVQSSVWKNNRLSSPDVFQPYPPSSNRMNLDGINITHGANHNHIWSYVAEILIKILLHSFYVSAHALLIMNK